MANFGDDKNLLKKENKVIDGLSDYNKTLHWFACAGGPEDDEERENNTTAIRDREEKLRVVREKQNEERLKKLEELKAQALAAQKFREQKEEERKRRIEDLRLKENDRRSQVEERKKAIWEAEQERREYILKKNQEREARIECKRKNERSSIVFAFGSSTPRLLNSMESTNVSPSAFWNHRRSTSISNVAFTDQPLTRRSSERDVSDLPKKRATSAGGLDRKNEDQRHMSASMYEVFNWSSSKEERPNKRYTLAIGPAIDIDSPINYGRTEQARRCNDDMESPAAGYRSVYRRKTDLMPTAPSPRDRSFYGSRSSLGSLTPRTPGRAVSMTRLDQLARPIRRNGEHIKAIIEREKRELEYENQLNSPTTKSPGRKISKSMSNLLHGTTASNHHHNAGNTQKNHSAFIRNKNLRKINTAKSMIHLASSSSSTLSPSTTTATTTNTNKSSDQNNKNVFTFKNKGLRSGDATPGGSINTNSSSRPGSSMSNSICAGVVQRRTPIRKPRPVSIAGTGMSASINGDLDVSKNKQEKPPLPRSSLAKSNSVSKSPARSIENVKLIEKKTPTPKSSRPSSKTTTASPAPQPTPRSSTKTAASVVTAVTNQDSVDNTEISMGSNHSENVDEILIRVGENTPATSTTTTITTTTTTQLKEDDPSVQMIQEKIEKIQIDDELVVGKEATPPPSQQQQQEQNATLPVESTIVVTETKVTEITETNNQQPIHVQSIPQQNVTELNPLENMTDMTASFIAKNRITTEEEAKAALAEKRRRAREEAERKAEQERLRLEEEERIAEQKQLEEEEEQRRLEEEAHRLAQLQRKAEEERLAQAIEEASKREEEERLKREEENRAKLEREETERKAREEAEKQRIETAERLKKEEKEREERRKRVEAIMARTRAKGGNGKNGNNGDESEQKPTSSSSENVSETAATTTSGATTQQEIATNNSNNVETTVAPNTVVVDVVAPAPMEGGGDGGLISLGDDQSNHNVELVVNNQENKNRIIEYENSVTEKENNLLGSFTNQSSAVSNNHHENGKLTTSNSNNQNIDLMFIENKNGHQDLSINNIKGAIETATIVEGKINDQLIDFSSAPHSIVDEFNNKSNNNNNTSTLVTSDSQENRDLPIY